MITFLFQGGLEEKSKHESFWLKQVFAGEHPSLVGALCPAICLEPVWGLAVPQRPASHLAPRSLAAFAFLKEVKLFLGVFKKF